MTNVRRARREGGIALVLVLLVIAVLASLGIVGTKSAQTELQIAEKDLLTKKALSVAEAGLNHAYSLVKLNIAARPNPPTGCSGCWGFDSELSSGGAGGALGIIGSTAQLNGNTYRFRAFGGGTADGYYVRALDNCDESSGSNNLAFDNDNRIYLESRGRVGGAERVITALLTGTSLFPVGVFGKLFVTLSGGSTTDSFDSRLGPYSASTAVNGGSVRSNGDVSLSGGSTVVKGDATAGGTVSTSGGASVTGTSTDGAPPLTFPSVPPCGPPYSDGTGITGGSYNASTGKLTGSGGVNVTFADGTYCFSSITLSGGSTLTVNGPVLVYVTAATDLSGGSIANTTAVAANLKLFSSLVDPSNHNGLKVSGGTQAYMAIDAPNTGVTFSGGNSQFYGAVVASSLTDTGGVRIHYDTALVNTLGPSMTLTGWHEVRN